ncbi:MAG: MBL fold metallo-hydrolase [Balneolales bacterium]
MIASLYEGTYAVRVDRKFVPVNPDDPPGRGALKLSINPFLIQNGNFTGLIDAGMGPFGPMDHHMLMSDNLKKHDLIPEDIQHVYCSHLHTDHIGGLLHERSGTYSPTFPNATIWLSGEDWQQFTINAEMKGHKTTVRWIHFLESHANLKYIEEETPQPETIRMITVGGHTKRHQAIMYHNKGEKAMMLGDILGRSEAINRKFAAKYDFDGKKSQQIREEYLRKAFEEEFILLMYHDNNGAIAALKNFDEKKGYEIEHITSGVIGSI